MQKRNTAETPDRSVAAIDIGKNVPVCGSVRGTDSLAQPWPSGPQVSGGLSTPLSIAVSAPASIGPASSVPSLPPAPESLGASPLPPPAPPLPPSATAAPPLPPVPPTPICATSAPASAVRMREDSAPHAPA